jgi:hypothetical protein
MFREEVPMDVVHDDLRSGGWRRAANWLPAATCSAVVLTMSLNSCGRPPAPLPEVTATYRTTLPDDPADPSWDAVPACNVALIPQDMVEPRLLQASTTGVAVKALHDGSRVVLRLEWADSTVNDLPGAARFSDACAVQIPANTGAADVPAPQMGEPNRPVEITQWKAYWQAAVDGRSDDIHALYPNARVDHYPFEAPSLERDSDAQRRLASQYAPARALENRMVGPRTKPVEDLRAEGPGPITHAAETFSEGRGKRTVNGWGVVITRPIPAGLLPHGRSQIAFAVWDGGREEVGARKMRSVWVPVAIEPRTREVVSR